MSSVEGSAFEDLRRKTAVSFQKRTAQVIATMDQASKIQDEPGT